MKFYGRTAFVDSVKQSTNELWSPDLIKVAEAMGSNAIKVKTPGELAPAVKKALAAIADDCRADRNVMPGIIEAAKAYCTEQEICDVFREVYGQHQDRPEF